MYINIHTHQPAGTGERSIVNQFHDFEKLNPEGYYSAGIHPWYIAPDPGTQFDLLRQYASNEQVLAIGETGLDKLCNTAWELQVRVFRLQIELALALQKPLIIHCVRAWNEVVALLEEYAVNIPVVFHGFNKTETLAKQLIEKGYYLSFGKSLEQKRIQQVLQTVPADQFLLETDDAPIPVSQVYNWAANALSIDLNALSLQIQQNAKAVFGPSFLV